MTKKERREYQKQYRACNVERLREYRQCNKVRKAAISKAWFQKNKLVAAEKRRVYLARNKEHIAARYKKWYERNAAHIQAQKTEYRARTRDVRNAYSKKYQKENLHVMRKIAAARRARRLRATPPWKDELSELIISEAYDLAVQRTKLTGFPWHVDHIVPLRGKNVCGLHVGWNLRVIPGTENLKKKNKHVT